MEACRRSVAAVSKWHDRFVKTVKKKAKCAALVWKEFGLTAGYHSHKALAAKGSYYIVPTFEQTVFNGYVVSQVNGLDVRYLCGDRGTALRKLGEAKAIAQADHDAGSDR